MPRNAAIAASLRGLEARKREAAGTEAVRARGDAVEFVRELKRGEGGDIIVMGGGELGSALIDGGVVDEIGLNVQPVLLGLGTPAFRAMRRRIDLEPIETRPFGEGCVLVRYRVMP